MINKDSNLREKYFSNQIFRIGDIVEDIKTGDNLKIIDRGSNYVTVASYNNIEKKWLNEIVDVSLDNTETVTVNDKKTDMEFELLESGQIKLFGYETKHFDQELSTLVLEQFEEFDDLYSKHQIVKCLDIALVEDNKETAYELLNKVEKLYSKKSIDAPFIVEVMKNALERNRIVEILAAIANVKPTKNGNYQTIKDSIASLKEKYQSRKQWEVLSPFFKLATDAGLTGITQNLPYNFTQTNEKVMEEEIIFEVIESNIDLTVEDLDMEDVYECFTDNEFSNELITETLSIAARNHMAIKMRQHTNVLDVKRDRAMNVAASTSVLMQRARRLAEVMIKRRMFKKPVGDMTRQEKERFESGATNRKAVIAKLASRLIGKVRMLQNTRLHHTETPASHTHDKATASLAHAVTSASTGAA